MDRAGQPGYGRLSVEVLADFITQLGLIAPLSCRVVGCQRHHAQVLHPPPPDPLLTLVEDLIDGRGGADNGRTLPASVEGDADHQAKLDHEERLARRPAEYLRLLAQAVDAKGDYFPGHSDGVAYVVRLMATEANLSDEHTAALMEAALMHDVGKLAVPTAILRASRRLTDAEYELMKEHPIWSERIAERSGVRLDVPVWVRHHHEHWDGSGYPDRLAGEQIPIESRILLVADAFHVMTNHRSYARAKPRSVAIGELERLAGVQFCPDSVRLLTERREELIERGFQDARMPPQRSVNRPPS